ncbi:MAG: molecular chaperone TorD family protein [Campylobacterales bacterium]
MQTRAYLYAFLSRLFADTMGSREIADLKANQQLLKMIGPKTAAWFAKESPEVIAERLNTDYTTAFVVTTQPLESTVREAKTEVLIGLENPVMAFYHRHGYSINLAATTIVSPDHLAIELGFMQNLILQDDQATQRAFMDEHLMAWAIPYLMGAAKIVSTPFYKEAIDFAIEFLASDYNDLCRQDHA